MNTVVVGGQVINSSLCTYAQYLNTAIAVQVMQWIEIVLDAIAFSSLTFFVRTKYFRKVSKLSNGNMKIIGASAIVCYYAAIIWSFVLHVYFKIRHFSAKTECDFMWYPQTCILFRLPVYYCLICFSLFHFILFCERAITTFSKLQLVGHRFGLVMSVSMFILAGLLTAIPLSTDNFYDVRPYCYSNSSMKSIPIIVTMVVAAVLDVLITMGDIYIYFYNKSRLNKKHTNTTDYTLSNSFRMRETELSMNIIFPYASIHASIYAIYLLSVIAPNFIRALSSLDKTSAILQIVGITKSTYLVGIPLLVLLLVKREDTENWLEKQKQISPQSYFDQFNQQLMPQRMIPPNKPG